MHKRGKRSELTEATEFCSLLFSSHSVVLLSKLPDSSTGRAARGRCEQYIPHSELLVQHGTSYELQKAGNSYYRKKLNVNSVPENC